MPKLIIGADIVPTITNQKLFENAQIEKIVDDGIRSILSQADYRIFNLEVPLTDIEKPIQKCGPNLIASTKSVAGLKQLGIDFLTLANNHILDQGEQGMWSTVEQLDEAGIAYAGIGHNIAEAAKPYIVEIDGMKVGIYCCAEHEFSIVSEKQVGANPFDLLESPDHITDLKSKCDYVICLYHGGKEHYRYPSPNLQKTCRKIVEKGADLVICQHSHCIGASEEWCRNTEHTGRIVYGQGNFLFDHSESEYWQTSLLIEVDIEKKEGDIESTIHYYALQKDREKVRLAEGADAEKILTDFSRRSMETKSKELMEKRYREFASSMLPMYLGTFMGKIQKKLIYRVLNKITGYRYGKWRIKGKYRKGDKLAIRNFIECEAHRELLLMGISNLEKD